MDGRETREKTPSKRILESIHNKLGLTTTCDKSPNWEKHKFSTPKNKVRMAKNPFEPLLHEVMHTNIMSPSVFAALPNKPVIDNEKFCWSIEELATFQPIDIEKSPFVQSEATDHVMEAVAQAKINKFFSAKTILPSPAGPVINAPSRTCTSIPTTTSSSTSLLTTPSPPPILSTSSSSIGTTIAGAVQIRRKIYKNTACQTQLSLPAELPEVLERLLKSYMLYDTNGRLNGVLYPDGYSSSDEGDNHSPPKAIQNMSPSAASPSKKLLHDSLNSEELTKRQWQLSPIAQDEDSGSSTSSADRCMRSRRSVAKLDFSAGHMSVDVSQQLCSNNSMPSDDLNGLSFHNNSLQLGNTPKKPTYSQSSSSPGVDDLQPQNSNGNDSSFSRMEDDYITFHRSRNASFEAAGRCSDNSAVNFDMDISFSNTPKSRSTSSTRRRLCDSFASFCNDDNDDDDDEDDDEEEAVEAADENDEKCECDDTVESGSPKKYKPNDLIRKVEDISSITDAGYNTASIFEESSLCFEKNANMFASTPTKTKIPFFPTNH